MGEHKQKKKALREFKPPPRIFIFYCRLSSLSIGIAIVNKESFKNSWIGIGIQIQEPWIRIMIHITTQI